MLISVFYSVLNPHKIKELDNAILAGDNENFEEVIFYCNKILENFPDNFFTYFIRGLAYLNSNEKEKALNDFNKVDTKEIFIAHIFIDYILGNTSDTDGMYKSDQFKKAFLAASQSIIFKNTYKVVENTILEHIKNSQPTSSVNIVDIGIGQANQVILLAKKLEDHNIKELNIIGIDPALLDIAESNLNELKNQSAIIINYQLINKKLEEMTSNDILKLKNTFDIDYIIASASIIGN